MNKPRLLGQCLLIAASVLLLPSTGAFANPAMPGLGLGPGQGGMFRHASNFDWVKHTQQTLEELKGKLSLKPEQMPAWETWAAGVIADANQQVEKGNAAATDKASARQALKDETTPQRMAKGIERLRTQTSWMQAQLVRLDAAQARTQTFYDALDAQQKTIFDLFWTVMHHRIADQDGWRMHMPMHMAWPQGCGGLNPTSQP
ncbi:Spy/CpxP family protein refolding chaperone [Pseudomonas veronii]|uniref:Spy/CpxP family protein refolding chaperone n=1 Tax=Pseudomonas veronii TaxID=76761 RepID=UPI0023DFA466|nr:Spy/CpxP family protein refolding chaperone [Pseudomonas veronii]MDF3242909.1 Spy/CpxP family protein refolding chaperone [Pseudomonas veronii]